MKHLIYSLLFFLLLSACTEIDSSGEQHNTAKTSEPIKKDNKKATPSELKPEAVLAKEIVIPEEFRHIDIAYLQGKFVPSKHPDFIAIETKHADRSGMYMRKDAYDAFLKMAAAAKKDGIKLTIRSAARNFDKQKQIWEGKWTGTRKVGGKDLSKTISDPAQRALKILEFSSMPSTSRHHWGTDIDLNAFTNNFFTKGEGLKIYNWLTANAAAYGYCQVYTPKGAERPDGYNEEKWHWSYLPVAKTLTDLYKTKIKNNEIAGFKGSEVATDIDIINKYVLGINKACL